MSESELPLITLKLEGMRYQVMHALHQHQNEISEMVNNELKKVIKNYPFGDVIADVANHAIKGSIESYFRYGKGNKEITTAITKILESTLKK